MIGYWIIFTQQLARKFHGGWTGTVEPLASHFPEMKYHGAARYSVECECGFKTGEGNYYEKRSEWAAHLAMKEVSKPAVEGDADKILSKLFDELAPLIGNKLTEDDWEAIGKPIRALVEALSRPVAVEEDVTLPRIRVDEVRGARRLQAMFLELRRKLLNLPRRNTGGLLDAGLEEAQAEIDEIERVALASLGGAP